MILDVVSAAVAYKRNHANIELEMRLGKIGEHFSAGMDKTHIPFIARLNSRLAGSAAHFDNWKALEHLAYQRSKYPGNVRQTIVPNVYISTIRKTPLQKIDIRTDRLFDLRLSLAEEITLTNDDATKRMLQETPESVQFLQRKSVREHIKLSDSFTLELQYDVTKVSREMPTKLQATLYPCTYQVEVEIVSDLKALADKNEENFQNEWIAKTLLSRAKALLGSYVFGSSEKLPEPELKLA